MPNHIKHDYALIAEMVAEDPGASYTAMAAEYTRRSGIFISNTVMKATIRRREATREMKRSFPRGRKRLYSYELIEWLIGERHSLADSPTRLLRAYNALATTEATLSGIRHILRNRPARLAREEAARNGQVESEDSDQGFDNSGDRSDSAL